MQSGSTNRNTSGLFLHIIYMLVSFIGTALFLYFYIFQEPSLFSIKRFLFSFACSGLVNALVFGILIYRQKLVESFKKISIHFLLLQAFLLTCYFILFIPQPVNHLFSKQITLQAEFKNESDANEFVELLWVNNGLRDISYATIQYDSGEIVDNTSINLPYNDQGIANFTWHGQAWKELTIVARSNEPFAVDFDINGQHSLYSYHPDTNQDFRMVIPIQSTAAKVMAEILVFVSILITACLILFLINLLIGNNKFKQTVNKEKISIDETLWKVIIIIPFILIIGYLVVVGLNNRLYSDDYCYLTAVRDLGYFGAVKEAFHVLNGRFMSHIANFSIFIWGSKLMPFGMLLSVIITGGSLIFFFNKILDHQKWIDRILFALILSASILLPTYYLAPYLYESAFWSLYTMTISSGFATINITAGLLLGIVNQPAISTRKRYIYSAGFLILGILSCGFHENISMLNLFFSGCILLWLLISKHKPENLRNIQRLLIFYILGGILGFGFNVLSSSEGELLSNYQVSFSFQSTLKSVYDLILVKLNEFYQANGEMGFIFFILIGLFAFLLGKKAVIKDAFLNIRTNKFVTVLLFLFPLAPFMISFVPSTFVSNYYPNRTFIVPLYFMVLSYFLLAFFIGVSQQNKENDSRIKWISIVLTLVIATLFIKHLQPTAEQFPKFAAEWDARDMQVWNAASEGNEATEVYVDPYQYSFGIDISTTNNQFLSVCYDNYYGIHVIPPE